MNKSYRISVLVVCAAVLVYLCRVYYLAGGRCQSAGRLDKMTVIITGANSGVGLATAEELARRGARILLACRNPSAGETAAQLVRVRSGRVHDQPQNIVFRHLDLSSFSSIRSFAETVLREEQRLDILINNAGMMAAEFNKTEDGFEFTWQVNHLGHFLLTQLLMNFLKGSAGRARIITVSSVAHRFGKINWKDGAGRETRATFSSRHTYWQSKLANVLFSSELAVRLRGAGVTSNSVHPGTVDSGFWRVIPTWMRPLWMVFSWLLLKTNEEGAQTTICAAVDPSLKQVTGEYLSDCVLELPSAAARSIKDAKSLWKLSEEQLGIKFNP